MRREIVIAVVPDKLAGSGWRGVPLLLRDHAAQWLRRHPALSERVGCALGERAPHQL